MTNKYKPPVVKYFWNTCNEKLYRVTNDKVIDMWYKSKDKWWYCCTTKQELYDSYHKGKTVLVSEEHLGRYK